MASTDLVLDIIARDKASRVLKDVGDNARKAGDDLTKAGDGGGRFSRALGGLSNSLPIVGAAIGGAVLGLGALAGSVIDTSSRLEELRNKSKTVFGDQLGVVEKWAKTSAARMKLTSSEAVGLATNFADLLIPMGFGRDAAAKMSTEVVGLSGALSKWSGGQRSASEVADILSGAMLGEYDSLKSLGIGLSASDVEARLAAKGQEELTGAARQQAEALAVQELIMEKSVDAQKAYADGNVTLRDRLDSLKVKFREVFEQLVEKLTPSLERFADWLANEGSAKLQEFGTWVSENKERIAEFALGVAAGAAGVAEGFLRMSAVAAGVFAAIVGHAGTMLNFWLGWADNILAAGESAFGWIPGIGDKIKGARDRLGDLKSTVDQKMPAVQQALQTSADKARAAADNVAGIKSNIEGLRDRVVTVTVRGVNEIDRGLDAAMAGRLAGARALGGPVRAGGTYLVGENGPERVRFGRDGYVSNARETAAMASPNVNVQVILAGREVIADEVRVQMDDVATGASTGTWG